MRRALSAVLTGSLLAGGPPVGWLLVRDPGPEQFGGTAARVLAVPAVASTGTAPTTSARLEDLLPVAAPPVRVRFAGQVAPVEPVGLDAARRVAVPDDVRRAGWYAPGRPPGAASGAAVLVGHVDDRDQGLGAFARLRGLAAGAEVVVETASGTALTYDVVSLEQFPKAEVPMTRLFATDGAHRLVLITCGGTFDPRSGSYRDNVVVTAVPRT